MLCLHTHTKKMLIMGGIQVVTNIIVVIILQQIITLYNLNLHILFVNNILIKLEKIA